MLGAAWYTPPLFSMTSIDELANEYFKQSETDHIVLPQLSVAARRWLGARTSEETQSITLELLRRLYEKGLRPGDYWGDNIVYWPDEGCRAMLDRIEREWAAAGEDPNLGEPICWLARPDKQD